MKRRLLIAAQYLSLFWPPAFRRLLIRVEERGINKGYTNGLAVGHRRGWLALRSKPGIPPHRYPHEPETP